MRTTLKFPIALSTLLLCLAAPAAHAMQSSITEADGESCMGEDKSRRETEQVALESAKRMAVEYTSSHISSTTIVENFELKNDIVEAFTQAEVKLLEILDKAWQQSSVRDSCVKIRIKAEVIPAAEPMKRVDTEQLMADPRLPLNVSLWVNSAAGKFQEGDKMKIYLQGNKPFYARLVYIDAAKNQIQLLPNQHRLDNYFDGGTILEIPTGRDKFELTVTEPFGQEKLILYASTEQLGSIETTPVGADVYLLSEDMEQVAVKTRGIALDIRDSNMARPGIAEFAEAEVGLTTGPRAED